MTLIDFVATDRDSTARPSAPLFTFPDSGVTVRLQRFAPDTIAKITRAVQKELPPPKPPEQEVDYGDGDKRLEANEHHPDHLAALQEYQLTVAGELGERLLRLVVRRVDVEVDIEVVQRFREDMEAIGVPIDDEDDKSVYVRHICISSDRDLSELSSYLIRRSQPTEAAVSEHIATF